MMRIMNLQGSILVALGLSLASPAAAQTRPTPPAQSPTLAADRTQIIACLRDAGPAAAASCIGLIAVACVRTASANPRGAEFSCARREEAVWRERLGQVVQMVGRNLDSGRRARLASLHLAWEGYVAQKCAFYGSTQRDGLQVGRQAGCELREVAERTLELTRSLPQQPSGRAPQAPPRIIR